MSIADVVTQAVPSAKALSVITGFAVTAFLAGAGFVLGWSDYSDLPMDVLELQTEMMVVDSTMAELKEGIQQAHNERHQILCLVRLTATEGKGLTPLEVQERCP
jgi:hypothetical protein|tara:strand:- start:4293 stop:4604 length:312 start_codon:yes stop_codon:yes gene_type:complete